MVCNSFRIGRQGQVLGADAGCARTVRQAHNVVVLHFFREIIGFLFDDTRRFQRRKVFVLIGGDGLRIQVVKDIGELPDFIQGGRTGRPGPVR